MVNSCCVRVHQSARITTEAQHAKSNADFVSKIEGGLQELEETVYWLELINEASIFPEERLRPLHQEAEELMAMFVTMVKNVKNKSGAGEGQ